MNYKKNGITSLLLYSSLDALHIHQHCFMKTSVFLAYSPRLLSTNFCSLSTSTNSFCLKRTLFCSVTPLILFCRLFRTFGTSTNIVSYIILDFWHNMYLHIFDKLWNRMHISTYRLCSSATCNLIHSVPCMLEATPGKTHVMQVP